MNPNVLIGNTSGLNSHPNEFTAPAGSTSVADNVVFNRDGLPERRNGFKDFSSNLPDFSPEQLLVGSNGADRYLHLDNGLWYYDTSSSMWLRKRGSFGAKATQPLFNLVLNGIMFYSASRCVFGIELATGNHFVVAGRFDTVGSTDGTGDAARFSATRGLATDGTNLYVCDGGNQTIRRIAPPLTAGAGVVTTIAGTAGASGSADGTGAVARFLSPQGIACDGTNLYVNDTGNNTVRRLAPPLTAGAAVVTTIAGTVGAGAFADGTGAAARFDFPVGIVFMGSDLFVADQANENVRRLAPPLTAGAAVVTTIAGLSGSPGSTDGTGSAARFNAPSGIAGDGTNLWLADGSNHDIRKLAPPLTAGAAIVTRVAGTALSSGSVDAIGTAARFASPNGVAYDASNLYVCDFNNSTIRKLYLPTAYVTTISGVSGSSAPAFGSPAADGIVAGPP